MSAPKGNTFGAKSKKFEGALRRALVRGDGALNRIADRLVKEAEAGESWAIQMVADRLDGKPKQQTELSGSIDTQVFVEIVRNAANPPAS